MLVAQAALNKQAEDVLVMDLRRVSNASDFFVLATATSHRQMLAISEQVEQELKQVGQRVWNVEGLKAESRWREQPVHELSWVLMDCGDVVVHVFTAPARDFYRLERLWADAPRVSLTESFDPSTR
ncbi:MAG: ribosome silencing factor [Candidatus Omnitrophica bacterium]|nr:ribosome silencing factor [Candidatus Omnitrophota bacterium]